MIAAAGPGAGSPGKAFRLHASQACGLAVLVLGLAVMAGWHLHWTGVMQVAASLPPMKYNAALAFACSGLGLLLLGGRRRPAVPWLGAAAAALGALTLAEYLTLRDFGIDQFFVRSAIDTATAFRGRMSPLAASCFLLSGAALIAAGRGASAKARLFATGVCACVVAMVAAVALLGEIARIDVASGWGAYTRMALHTTVGFLLLGGGLLAWTWRTARGMQVDFLQWLLVTGSTTLLAMIAFVSTEGLTQMKRAAAAQQHSLSVVTASEALLADLLDIQRGLDAYVLTRHPAALERYRNGVAGARPRLRELLSLVRSPEQRTDAHALSDDVEEALGFARELIEAREKQGLAGAAQIESSDEDLAVIDRAMAALKAFSDEENRLLERRSAGDADFHGTVHLLIFGVVLAAVLLVLSNLLTGREVARRRRMEAAQRELAERARAGERAKAEFLAVMSHEIRTPMNGVIGMAGLLADTPLDEYQRDCLKTIQTSGESLLAVINDILDFSKMESGRMTLESIPFPLAECLEEAFDLFAPQIRAKRLEAVYSIDAGVPPCVAGDPVRLRQILVNLIGNAIKFTPEGEIVAAVRLQRPGDPGSPLLFSVADTGIGIPPEAAARLFRAFQQADAATTRRYGGTGLGLAISKRLAELMGGTMWVESEPGKGSAFLFTAALAAAAPPGASPALRAGGELRARPVLVVDDNATNRRILEAQLSSWGMTVRAAASGGEALRLLDEGAFAVGLLDLLMPGVDGIALAREIRRRSAMPLVLLSSSGEPVRGDDAALFQSQVPKPIKQSALFNALQRAVGIVPRPAPREASPLDGGMAAGHPLRILLAEDNAVNQKVGLRMLSRLGYAADLATNGNDVLQAAARKAYDVVLMDAQMPGMDGIEATRLLKERLGPNCPRIVALTAEAMDGDRDRFLRLGFDDYLSKPLHPAKLKEALKAAPVRKGQPAPPGPLRDP